MSFDTRRVAREVKQCQDFEGDGVIVQPNSDDVSKLVGVIKGPEDSPYEGGLFSLVSPLLIPGYQFTGPISLLSPKSRLFHPRLSSKRFLSDWLHLSGYSKGSAILIVRMPGRLYTLLKPCF